MRGRPIHRYEELCWSDQEVDLYPVHIRVQEHGEHVTTGDIPRVNFIEGTSHPSSKAAQEGKEETNETGPGQAGTGDAESYRETETATSTQISTFWGTKGWW